MRCAILILILSFISVAGEAQVTEADTLEQPRDTISPKDPKKAAIMSAVIPGLGQIYNHKYWKLPIVYGGLGTSVYLILSNRQVYKQFKQYYLWDVADSSVYRSPYYREVIPDELKKKADQYRAWMEYSYIGFAAVYILQIVDASVDAHLSTFDVSEDLSVRVMPNVQYAYGRGPVNGLSLTLNF